MRDNLINLYPGRFSIPGETQMKQFIGKLSQHKKNKQKKKSLTKSTRGMKAGNLKPSQHPNLSQIIQNDPKEKPEAIYHTSINTFGDKLPYDLPSMSNKGPDKEKIKQAIARFKLNTKKKEKRSIIDQKHNLRLMIVFDHQLITDIFRCHRRRFNCTSIVITLQYIP